MTRITLLVLTALTVAVLLLKTTFVQAAGTAAEEEALVNQALQEITPMSITMVDSAMDVLAKGWAEMDPGEQAVFLLLFDPANSGAVDEAYVDRVKQNYQKIRDAFDQEIDVAFEPDSDQCIGERLYYVDPLKLHVCPYFLVETITSRKARSLIHEVAHLALPALDRPYYTPDSAQYAALKPTAGWMAELPLVGPVLREILRQDTLFHPDAYAHFSLAVSSQPGALALYLGGDAAAPGAAAQPEINSQPGPEEESVQPASSSWIRKH